MNQDIKFHCTIDGNFRNKDQQIRAFLFTDYFIEPHDHAVYEMNIVLSGKGYQQIGEHCFEVAVGDVFVIPPNTVHSYYETHQLAVYHILIKSEFLAAHQDVSRKVAGYLQLTEIEPFLRKNFSKAMFLHLSHYQLLRFKEEIKFIDDHGEYGNNEFAPMKQHAVMKLIYWFSQLLNQQLKLGKQSVTNYENAVINALEYIHQKYDTHITVQTLCELTYMSRSTFLRSFSRICGCSPAQYIDRYRCSKAVEMLEKGGISKTQIAHSCGFYDLSHMLRKLQAHTE